jgi:hypothetical protein
VLTRDAYVQYLSDIDNLSATAKLLVELAPDVADAVVDAAMERVNKLAKELADLAAMADNSEAEAGLGYYTMQIWQALGKYAYTHAPGVLADLHWEVKKINEMMDALASVDAEATATPLPTPINAAVDTNAEPV